jgi:hypothetical protein
MACSTAYNQQANLRIGEPDFRTVESAIVGAGAKAASRR